MKLVNEEVKDRILVHDHKRVRINVWYRVYNSVQNRVYYRVLDRVQEAI